MKDFHEKNLRGVLNFGHTIGHALEGLSMRGDVNPLFHGDAVAAGMICAAWLSQVKTGLPAADMNSITKFIAEGFPLEKLEEIHKNELLSLLKQDKKMKNGKIHFTLITKPGHPVINIPCEPGEITDAILFYNTIVAGKSETGGYQPGNQ
jgi:3-dehydroquinate synthase